MLALIVVSIFALTLGVLIGRSGVRAEQRRSVVVLQPHRVYEAWSKTDRKN